jgi:microcystin-dependent protein
MVIRNEKQEGFADFPLISGDTIRLVDGLSAVKLGVSGNRNVSNMMDELVPPLTIVAYAGATAPTGWQICNGDFLKKNNGSFYLDSNRDKLPTPNLKGRTIIGTNETAGSGISARRLGETGGAETHKLTVPEMPKHGHNVPFWGFNNCTGGDCKFNLPYTGRYTNDAAGTSEAGDDQPHNNMQPYFVLNYIIKQPTADS